MIPLNALTMNGNQPIIPKFFLKLGGHAPNILYNSQLWG